MAWQMLKKAHNMIMVINDDSPCTDVNEVRDPDNGYCYGLMSKSLSSSPLFLSSIPPYVEENKADNLRRDERRLEERRRRYER